MILTFLIHIIYIHRYQVVLYYCRCLNAKKKFKIRNGRKSDPTVITYVLLLIIIAIKYLPTCMDVTMAVHFDVPNVDYESLTLIEKSVPWENCETFMLYEANKCCPKT